MNVGETDGEGVWVEVVLGVGVFVGVPVIVVGVKPII